MSDKKPTRIKERPLIFFDLEFSGLDWQSEILQIACIRVEQPGMKITAQWEAKTKPQHIETGNPESLQIVGYTDEKWRDAISLRDALTQFNDFIRDGVLVGYNPVMDFLYLKKTMHEMNLQPAFHWQVIDVMSMAFKDLYNEPLVEYRMGEVTKRFDIKNDKHHDALADAQMTYEIFMKLWQTS